MGRVPLIVPCWHDIEGKHSFEFCDIGLHTTAAVVKVQKILRLKVLVGNNHVVFIDPIIWGEKIELVTLGSFIGELVPEEMKWQFNIPGLNVLTL